MPPIRPFEPAAYAASSGAGCYWPTTVEAPPAPPALSGTVRADVAAGLPGFRPHFTWRGQAPMWR